MIFSSLCTCEQFADLAARIVRHERKDHALLVTPLLAHDKVVTGRYTRLPNLNMDTGSRVLRDRYHASPRGGPKKMRIIESLHEKP